MDRVLVLFLTDRGAVHQNAARSASPPNFEVTMLRTRSEAEVIAHAHSADVIVSERNIPVTRAIIDAAPRLRMIVRLGSLSHDIDLGAAVERNVVVCRQPVLEAIFAAEHVSMMIFALARRLPSALFAMSHPRIARAPSRTEESVFAFDWSALERVSPIYAQRMLLFGMGEIGVELARRFRPFRLARFEYLKRSRFPEAIEDELGIEYAFDPIEALRRADIVVSLLPLSPETEHKFSRATIGAMKPSALFVHAGSGRVVDEAALAEAIAFGRIRGAALDTFEWEPLPPDDPLVRLMLRDPDANLLLTPHVASLPEVVDRRGDFREIERFFAGEPLAHRIA
jgi:phosphoglycerate dehydrogenase-like enzyme